MKKPNLRLLHIVETCGGMIVTSDNLVEAARLVDAGFAKLEDDYEGPRMTTTPAGIKEMDKKLNRTKPTKSAKR